MAGVARKELLDLTPPALPNLVAEVARLLRQVPAGRVTTFGDLAQALGAREAAAWIGQLVRRHECADGCPCHRVVKAGGLWAGAQAEARTRQVQLLRREGVKLGADGVASPESRWAGFRARRPLAAWAEWQERLALAVRLEPLAGRERLIAAVDVSYRTLARPRESLLILQQRPAALAEGVAACVLLDRRTGKRVHEVIVRREVVFPYVRGLLAARETPLLVAAVAEPLAAGIRPDVLIVDGTGVLHPRGAGIACGVGLLTGLPTVGVTKKRLFGKVDAEPSVHFAARAGGRRLTGRLVRVAGEPRGMEITGRRRWYVSPAHRADVATAAALVAAVAGGSALPEPVYWADRLSREAARRG